MRLILDDLDNRIYIDDSFEILPRVDDKKVDLILTDPPYNLENDQKEFIHQHLIRISRGATIVFSHPENQWILPADQYLFWTKPISTKNTSKRYSRFVEMIFVYGNGAWNTERHWSQYTNIFHDLVDTVEFHSFRKPPSLIERLILNHSNAGDTILDPFAGSGIVAETCKKLNRRFVCIEKDEELGNEIRHRLHKF